MWKVFLDCEVSLLILIKYIVHFGSIQWEIGASYSRDLIKRTTSVLSYHRSPMLHKLIRFHALLCLQLHASFWCKNIRKKKTYACTYKVVRTHKKKVCFRFSDWWVNTRIRMYAMQKNCVSLFLINVQLAFVLQL